MNDDLKVDYVDIVYNTSEKPITKYPDQLTRYLAERYGMKKGVSILDLGCGRGDFLRGFIRCGLKGFGVDQSLAARKLCPEADIIRSDLAELPLPYKNNSFDYIYSKSVIEHFYYPERLVREIFRLLKPGGLAITMTPDWEYHYKIFYRDFTHRTPFTDVSLKNIFLIDKFDKVSCEKFYQLPFLWNSPWLLPFIKILACITPEKLGRHSKLIRFSKEVMLLCSGKKPIIEKGK